jgi:hypothetical protein
VLARARAAALRTRAPRLTLAPAASGPADLVVWLDGERQGPSTFGVPLPVDPGPHKIEATAQGRATFRKELALAEAESGRVDIALEPAAQQPAAQQAEAPPGTKTPALVVGGVAVAFGVTAIIFTALHNSDVTDINAACQPRGCPESRRNEITARRQDALRDETLAIVFGAASLVGLGVGGYLYFRASPAPRTPTAWLSPAAPGAPAGLSLRGAF